MIRRSLLAIILGTALSGAAPQETSRLIRSIKALEVQLKAEMKKRWPGGEFPPEEQPSGLPKEYHPSTPWFFAHWDNSSVGELIRSGVLRWDSPKSDWQQVERWRERVLKKLKAEPLRELHRYSKLYPRQGNRYLRQTFPMTTMEAAIFKATGGCVGEIEAGNLPAKDVAKDQRSDD